MYMYMYICGYVCMCDENPFNSLPTNYIGMIAQCPYLLKGSLKNFDICFNPALIFTYHR